MDLGSQKSLFNLSGEKIYMSAAGRTPLLASAADQGYAGVQKQLQTPWSIGDGDEDLNTIRDLFAEIINAPSKDYITTCPATSYAMSVAAKNIISLGAKMGRVIDNKCKILLIDGQMGSNVYAWQDLCEETGAKLVVMQRTDSNSDWTEIILAKLEEDRGIAIVALPNVHWCDGSFLDLVKIGAACRDHGTYFVIDGTQSIGVIPFDVQEVKPDFLAVSVHKWLLGAYGCSIMYVSERWWSDGQPIEHHDRGRIGASGNICLPFNNKSDTHCYEPRFQAGAARFLSGGRPNPILFPILRSSLQQVLKWGIPNIQATLMRHTTRIQKCVRGLGLLCAKQHTHIIGISHPTDPQWAEEAAKFMAANNMVVVERLGYLRCAPYLYNTNDDIQRLCDLLTEFAQK